MSDRRAPGQCPSDMDLRQFDLGALSPSDSRQLSEHVAHCQRCGQLLSEQRQEDTRLMAELLTPGTALLAEREYQLVRRALLKTPENLSAEHLELAETSLSVSGPFRDGQLPREIGSYRLRYELGRGAMGVVFRARHVNLKRDAALKILHPHLVIDREIVERFYREMEAIGQLRDPHIVQAHDAGESGGVHFLAMEYVDGADAARLSRRLGRMSVPDACEIARQAALGLETARRHEMVHRDVKPSNLMVDRNGQVKILDLGLASFREESGDFRLEDDAVGTVDYMAPEQWLGSPRIDIRADIYSLGCTLWRLLLGRPPFFDAPDDGVSKMQAHLSQPLPSLRDARREVPRELESLVVRMLAKKPRDRGLLPREIAESLEPFCQGSRLDVMVEQCVPEITDEASPRPEPLPARQIEDSRRRRPRRRIIIGLAAVVLFALIGIPMGVIGIRWTQDGAMVVTVDHADAQIQVGSVSISTREADQPVEIRLDSGPHEVTVTKDGFEPRQEKIVVRRGSRTPLNIKLTPQQQDVTDRTMVLVGHKGPINAVDISADGKWILTGSRDRTVRLWNAETGEQRLQLSGHEDAVLDVVFTPDGQHAVSASKDHTARLWDLETGKQLQQFAGHRDAVRCVAVSEDGSRLLTGSNDAQVRLWDLDSGQLLATLGAHRSGVCDVALLPGGHQAVSCSNDRLVILWDLETGQMRKVLQGHTKPVSSVSVADDGRYLVTGGWDMTVRLWDLQTRQQLNVMRQHTGMVRSARFVPGSNNVVSCSDDRDVRLWNPFSGESLAEISGHTANVTDVAVNVSAGLVASASADRTVRVGKLPPLGLNPSPDELVKKTLTPLIGETAVVVKPVRQWATGRQGLRTVAVAPSGQRIATGAGEEGVIRIWKTETGQLDRELTEPTDGNLCLRFSPDGQWLAAAGKDRLIYVWDMTKPSPAKTLVGHKGWVAGLAFSTTGQRLLSGSFDATIRLWDVKKETMIRNLQGRIEWVRAVALGRNRIGPLTVTAGNAGCVRLWTTGKGPNGRMLGFVRPLEMPYLNGQISSIALTSDGRLVAAAGWNRPVQVWNTVNGRRIAQFGEKAGTVYDLKWMADDKRLLTASADGTLRLWDRRNGAELKRYLGHQGAVEGIGLSSDLQTIASVGDDGMVCLWPAETIAPDTQTVAETSAARKRTDANAKPGADSGTDAASDGTQPAGAEEGASESRGEPATDGAASPSSDHS